MTVTNNLGVNPAGEETTRNSIHSPNTTNTENLMLLNACESCGGPGANRTCGGCLSVQGIRVVRYCTSECEQKDWKFRNLDGGGLKVCECRNCRVSDRGGSSTSAAPA